MEHNSSSEILVRSIGEKFPVFNVRNIGVFNRECQLYLSLDR